MPRRNVFDTGSRYLFHILKKMQRLLIFIGVSRESSLRFRLHFNVKLQFTAIQLRNWWLELLTRVKKKAIGEAFPDDSNLIKKYDDD